MKNARRPIRKVSYGVAAFLLVAVALMLASAGGHQTKTESLKIPSWPESNTLVATQAHSSVTRASLTIRFRPGTSTAVQRHLLARFGAVETSSIAQLHLHVVAVDTSKAVALLGALRSARVVAAATPDEVRQVAGRVSGSAISRQWALQKIGWPAAHRAATAKRRVTIAVLDTGVDASLPALAGRLGPGYSAFSGASASTDPNGHGTWMASIAGAVAPAARLMPVQVLNPGGLGKDSDIIKGLVWAADHHANVIAMSFAGQGYSPALQGAIDYAWSKGAVIVAATGNAGSSEPTYPAGDAKVVGVSATDSHDHLWSRSNFGSDTFLAAPGVDVQAYAAGGGVSSVTGTSASAALVAGSAALLLGHDPKASNALVVGRLAASADKVGTRSFTGNGRLNLARALAAKVAVPVVPAGVAGRATGGPFVGPYVVAGSSTAPTVVGSNVCPNAAGVCSASASTLVVTLTAAVPLNATLFIVAARNASSVIARRRCCRSR